VGFNVGLAGKMPALPALRQFILTPDGGKISCLVSVSNLIVILHDTQLISYLRVSPR
jgi:hypothetical protein